MQRSSTQSQQWVESDLRLGLGVIARVWIGLKLRVVLWQAPQTEQAVASWAFMQSGVSERSPATLLALIRLLIITLRAVRGVRGSLKDAFCPLFLAPCELGLRLSSDRFGLGVGTLLADAGAIGVSEGGRSDVAGYTEVFATCFLLCVET